MGELVTLGKAGAKAYQEYDESQKRLDPQRFNHKKEKPPLPTSDVWGHAKGWMLPGSGKVTNPDKDDKKACGKFYGVKGCTNVEGHNFTTLSESGKSINHKGMMFGRKQFRYCNDPRCPICYKHGWANREETRAEVRFKKGEKRFGKMEQIIFSQPREDESLTETPEGEREYRRTKLKRAIAARGIEGGSTVFHPLRFADRQEAKDKGVPFGWRYSPHYHVNGFIKGGFSRCRGCSHNNFYDREEWCMKCQGFEGRKRRAGEKDGWYCKIAVDRKGRCDARVSIWATLRYQLDHCGIAVEKKGYHNITWFGVVSYRALKVTKEDFEEVGYEHKRCPLCGKELEDLRYLGSDFDRLAGEFWVIEFEEPFLDKDGNPRWAKKIKSPWFS
jgi:hypothetical protein